MAMWSDDPDDLPPAPEWARDGFWRTLGGIAIMLAVAAVVLVVAGSCS